MEFRKLFVQFVATTAPAVVVYFIGWAYLYYFLGSFGINIGEIHTDAATIFIYSFPVFRSVAQLAVFDGVDFFWPAVIFIVAVVLTILATIRAPGPLDVMRVSPDDGRYKKLRRAVAAIVGRYPLIRYLAIAGLVVIAVIAVNMATERTAFEATRRVWNGKAISAVALVKNEPNPDEWRTQYAGCSKSQALLLIYADDKAYYLLCKNSDASTDGTVFEVRRDNGLSSVRYVAKGTLSWLKPELPR